MKLDEVKNSYSGISKIFRRYWKAYGGGRALILSPYLHLSVLLTAAMYPLWIKTKWWDIAISVAPSILGFSLAGYAIWLALGDNKFRRLISETDSGDLDDISPFMSVNAAFVHFMLLQVTSLITSLLIKAHMDNIETLSFFPGMISAFGFMIFIYSILCVLAATFAILRVSSWYEMFVTANSDNDEGDAE